MTPLRQGSSGPEVTELQQKLKDLGFDPNGVDGNFGPGTRDAVITFQQSKGLQADGIAGPATLAALGLGDGQANADTASSDSTDTGSIDTGSAANTAAAAGALNLGALASCSDRADSWHCQGVRHYYEFEIGSLPGTVRS